MLVVTILAAVFGRNADKMKIGELKYGNQKDFDTHTDAMHHNHNRYS